MDRNQAADISTRREAVALRKESVDRNNWIKAQYPGCRLSLSARRAWIEMQISVTTVVGVLVALRKESVDRNCDSDPVTDKAWGRSPQGERG